VVRLHVRCGWIFVHPAVTVEGADLGVREVHFGAGEDDLPLRPPEHGSGIEAVEPFEMLLPLYYAVRYRPWYVCWPTWGWMQTWLDVSWLRIGGRVIVCVGPRVVHAC